MKRALIALLLIGCRSDLETPQTPVELDRPYFDCRVQPVLTKLCSNLACHGDGARFFRVFARGRLRLGGDETQRSAFLRTDERALNYQEAINMVDWVEPEDSLLLRKPLEVSAGGYYHVGAHTFGSTDVFADREDADYRALEEWVMGATEEPSCIEPGSEL